MKRVLLGTTLFVSAAATGAFATTVSTTVTAGFSVSGQSLFGSGGASAFNGSVGFGTSSSTFQFGASTGASTGSINSSASVSVNAAFAMSQEIGTSNIALSFGGATAGFNTSLGAFIDVGATVRTPEIPVPFLPDIPSASIPFTLVDEDYQLNTNTGAVAYSFGQTISDDDSVSLPGAGVGVGITVNANPNVDQDSDLRISGMNTTLVATNQTTGTVLTDSFLFNGGLENILFDFSEAGVWDLSLQNLSLNSSFDSDFGLSATFSGGVEIGLGCGNPATDNDNDFGCLFDAGVSTTTSTASLLPIDPFGLNYNSVSSLALGSINVTAPPAAVPLPASLPLLAAGFGLMGFAARRRKASRV
ncbi:MAG: PEP-CTERM sorting domain-containing protein [Pseudomonadota bacterium]